MFSVLCQSSLQLENSWLTWLTAVYPGLVESIDAKNYTNAIRWSGIIEDSVKTATANIKVGHHG